jgi:hypothetical protein
VFSRRARAVQNHLGNVMYNLMSRFVFNVQLQFFLAYLGQKQNQNKAFEINSISVSVYAPFMVTRQRFGKHVPASTNTHATTEFLDAVFSMRHLSYGILNM